MSHHVPFKIAPEKDAYSHACAMEKPLELRQFTAALARLAVTMEDGQAASIVQELTLAIEESLDELDGSHGFFFELHHPDRALPIQRV
jgi:hypothetical protein